MASYQLPEPRSTFTTQEANYFLDQVHHELQRAALLHPRINSTHEGYAVILEELDEFKAEVWKHKEQHSSDNMYTELIQLAAMAARVALDCIERGKEGEQC